jgi:flagellar hook protein FlgE
MALTSALFTGLSGLNVNQTWLNVIGNNIANANTTAFKSSSVAFSPQFYVTQDAGTPSGQSFGGTNPSQEGLGASIGSINVDFSQGSLQTTGVDTNMAVNGAGFFVVQAAGQQSFTRDGTFSLNDKNQLVTASGGFVQGYGVDSNFNVVPGTLQNVTIPVGTETIAKATSNISMTGNLNSGGTPATGASILTSQPLVTANVNGVLDGTTVLTDLRAASAPAGAAIFNVGDVLSLAGTRGGDQLPTQTFTVTTGSTVSDLESFFNQGMEIDTTVAGAPGPTPGTTFAPSPSDAAGTARLMVTGNSGSANNLTIAGSAFTGPGGANPLTFADGTNAAGVASDPNGESVETALTGYDSLGSPVAINVTAVLESQTAAGTNWRFYATSPDNQGATQVLGDGTLSFDNQGNLTDVTGNTLTLDRSGTGATPMQSVTLNFSGVNGLSNGANASVLQSTGQDGSALGTLSSFSVGNDGTITGSFTNGLTRTIGQVALANFQNPDGLVNQGSNLYQAGSDSGPAVIGAPETLGSGSVLSGTLEQSNVDISKEFINMIIASTGFSGSSRVITTSDQLITNLLNSTPA